MGEPLRIANCSGFFGDRLEAAAEMVEGGPIDVLTGDYLAELTMAILWRSRSKDPGGGYVSTFLTQMEQVLGNCLAKGIRVVANAGGLAPGALAERLRHLADRLGLPVSVGLVAGDDLADRLPEVVAAAGGDLPHLDSGRPFAEVAGSVLTAHAYLGGWGIAAALGAGADVVVTGRVADAALVSGPAAWHHGWAVDDWDALAGAVVAGHVVECGPQCTGGNYPFFEEIPGLERPGFPIAEIHRDGSSVITKHPGTGGAVTTGTVTAQLLYEIAGPRYPTPDVVALFDTIALAQEGPDRVRISGVRGEPAPPTAKLAINALGGFRNTVTLLVPGPDVTAKSSLVERTLRSELVDLDLDFDLVRSDRERPRRNAEGLAELRVIATAADPDAVGRAFTSRVIELALSSYPGFTATAPPGRASPVVVFWPALAPAGVAVEVVTVDGGEIPVPAPPRAEGPPVGDPGAGKVAVDAESGPECCAEVPLGLLAGARSGDKGGTANIGVWGRSAEAAGWLSGHLTPEKVAALLPEAAELPIEVHRFPLLGAVNIVIRGLLGEGVSSSTRVDPQAKTLGEFLRTRTVEAPLSVIESVPPYHRRVVT